MKQRILPLLIFLMAPLCTGVAFSLDKIPPESIDNEEAESVMNQYFAALVNGDVVTLKLLLGGDLLKKRSRLLDNPEYPGYLSSTYTNAAFRLLNINSADPDFVQVDALITFNQDEVIRKRYTLRKSLPQNGITVYQIVREASPAGAL